MTENAYATLPERKRKFVDAYLGEANGNASRAWMIISSCKSESSAAASGCRALKDPMVQLALTQRRDEIRVTHTEEVAKVKTETDAGVVVTREKWIQEVARVAFDRDVKPGVRAPYLKMLADAEGYIERATIQVNQVNINVDARSLAMIGGGRNDG